MKKFVLVLLIFCFFPLHAFGSAALDYATKQHFEKKSIGSGPILKMSKAPAYRKQLEDAFIKKYCSGEHCTYGINAYHNEVVRPYLSRKFEIFWIKPDRSCVWLDSDGKEWKCSPTCEPLGRPPSD